MEDIENKSGGNLQNSPLTGFQSDDLLEKLKLLNYEKNLLAESKMKPLSRFYFVTSTNPGEQFYMFTLIAWWLYQKLGKHMDKPQEYDDPNDVIGKIITLLQEMDVSIDFTPNKLMRGAGPNCLYVLDSLATQAVKVMKVTCRKPHITQDEEANNDYLDDNAEIILEKIEDEQTGVDSDDNSELDLNDNPFMQSGHKKRTFQLYQEPDKINENSHDSDKLLDEQVWRLEFEQVLPKLKVYIRSDVRDWRAHLGQMDTLRDQLIKVTDDTQGELRKLYNEFTFNLEKLESREKHLNNELHNLIVQYKDVSIELSNVQNAQTQALEEIENTTEQLKTVMAENDARKTEMERRGQLMSDSSLVTQIKKAIAKLKEDIAYLSLEVALLVNGIDRDIMRKVETTIESVRVI